MIFLTGGTGLVGRHVIAAFAAAGERVVAMARSDPAAAELSRLGAEPLRGSVDDPAAWRRVEGCRAVVHSAAAIAAPGGWGAYQRPNVEGSRLAASHARALGVPLVHISSIAVYTEETGDNPPGTVTESAPIGSRTNGMFYGRSKRLAEDAVWEEVRAGLSAVVLRPCLIYGEGDRIFLPSVVRFAKYDIFPLVGWQDLPLAMVHARSVAEAVTAALRTPAAIGRAYNITEDDAITGVEFAAALAEGLARPVRTLRIPEPVALGAALLADAVSVLGRTGAPGYRSAVRFLRGGNPYSSAAARREFGWSPTVRHREALVPAIRAARNAR